jgi:Calcineurin-like phosphoesterase
MKPYLTFLTMILLASRICLIRGFAPSVRPFCNKAALRLFSVGPDIDPSAQLSTFTTLQNNFQLPKVSDDKLALRENQRLVCFGDVHGDLTALKDFLTISKVYDGNRWVGGDSILVQCGDVLDRGSEELQCLSLLTDLSRQAQEEGGRVILLWGNHEALNAAGLFQYTTGDAEYEQYVGTSLDASLRSNRWRLQFAGNQPARWAAFEPGGLLASPLLANMKVAVQVGKTVCVHAGLTKQHLQQWGGLEGMNRMAHDWIQSSE